MAGRTRARAPLLVAAWLLSSAAVSVLEAQSVTGRVQDERSGMPLAGALIRLLDAQDSSVARAVTDSTGRFTVAADAAGEFTLRIERFGFAPVAHDLTIASAELVTVEARLAPRAVPLDPVVVVARDRRHRGPLAEFYNRAERTRRTGLGRVYTREDLEGMGFVWVRSLLAGVPRRGCQMSGFVDGLPLGVDYIEESIHTADVEGIEIYRGITQIPPEIYRPGMCGAVLVWSRAPDGTRPFSWIRMLVGGGLFALLLILQ